MPNNSSIYDLLSEFLELEMGNCSAGLSAYESLPNGKPLSIKKEDDEEGEDNLHYQVDKIRDTFKENNK